MKNIGAHQLRPCGKYFNQSVYVHKDYAHLVKQIDMSIVDEYASELPSDFDYNLIRYDRSEKKGFVCISFINLVNFDSADTPLVGDAYHVKGYGYAHINNRFKRLKFIRMKNDPQIKIHKWLYVPQDYKGFDWNKAVEYSERWTKFNRHAPQKLSEWIKFLKDAKQPIEKWHKSYLPTEPKKKPMLVEDRKYDTKLDQLSYDAALEAFKQVYGYVPSEDNKNDVGILIGLKCGITNVLRKAGI